MTMKWEQSEFKGTLARARGLGSAHDGTGHWIAQRITAILNIPLVLWAVWSIVGLVQQGLDYVTFTGWLAEPVNAILMILFILSSFYHAVLGNQVVIEDYIHCEGFKIFKLVGNLLVYFALGIASIFAILKIAL
ncbi:MAG: succinate dehydrogenase, hydrophobic membrane anchor protein [Pseudobdellovibrionaceae bacterium]